MLNTDPIVVPGAPDSRRDEQGSILVVLLVLTVGFAAFAQATLSKTVVEHKKGSKRFLARQVLAEADGQLEVARNVVNASPYTGLANDALSAALSSADGLIPGTQVSVERLSGTAYFALRTLAERNGVTKSAEAVVREASPASAFNLFVIDHPVGISGQPRGAIHSNRHIDLFFAGNVFRDSVTAAEGFQYVAGADLENTTFLGEVNGSAATSDLLRDVDFGALQFEADVLSVPDTDLVAEVILEGDYGRVDLFRPAHTTLVERTRTRDVLTGYTTETFVDSEPIRTDESYEYDHDVYVSETFEESYMRDVYDWRDVSREVTSPIYELREVSYTVEVPITTTETRTRPVTRRVWVSLADSEVRATSSGGTVGASSDLEGYWTTVTETEEYEVEVVTGSRTETRTRMENVRVGEETRTVTSRERYLVERVPDTRTRTRSVYSHTERRTGTRSVITGYRDVVRTREVPVYEQVTETYEEEVLVDEEFVRSETFPVDGTVYLGGDVRSIGGTVRGRLSLIANGKIRVTDSIQYVDSDGDTRMLNGLDPGQPYTDNPDYEGDSLLALMARDDLVYASDGPARLEVNASLLSAEGSVGFEGIVVSEDGENVGTAYETGATDIVKDSLRRLGGVVCRERPVATYIDEYGYVGAGYERGTSIMDRNLLLTSGNNAPPPFTFEAPQPTWVLSTSGTRLGSID
jgi:hypothetical protein